MHLIYHTATLFALNLLDAVLTIIWVRSGVATEGNQIMARVLETGALPFLLIKLAVGTVMAFVILRYGKSRIAKYGMTIALAAYASVMVVHLIAGLHAFGYVSDATIEQVASLSHSLIALFV
jgi:Domain of unknown function (DUF5658)